MTRIAGESKKAVDTNFDLQALSGSAPMNVPLMGSFTVLEQRKRSETTNEFICQKRENNQQARRHDTGKKDPGSAPMNSVSPHDTSIDWVLLVLEQR